MNNIKLIDHKLGQCGSVVIFVSFLFRKCLHLSTAETALFCDKIVFPAVKYLLNLNHKISLKAYKLFWVVFLVFGFGSS